MKNLEEARELAHAMVSIGNHVGRKTMAVISDMSQPLGRAIGNALEVNEAMETLKGNGPKDLTDLCLTLGSQMVILAGKAETLDKARTMLVENMNNGKALAQFKTFLASQGGDETVVDHPEFLPQAAYQVELKAKTSGTVKHIIADDIGTAAMLLGAGRATKDSVIDLAVGIVLHKKVGDTVQEGESLLTIHTNQEQIENVKEKLYNSITIADTTTSAPELIYDLVTD